MCKSAQSGSRGLSSEKRARAVAAVSRLAPIEQTILQGLANGESSKSLAETLGMHLLEIEEFKLAAMTKLRASSTAEAVRIALLSNMDVVLDRTSPR